MFLHSSVLLCLILAIAQSLDAVNSTNEKIKVSNNIIDELLNHPNEIVDKYVKRPLDYSYGSAVLPLAVSGLVASEGDILEIGIGHYSTSVFRKIVKTQTKRKLISLELDKRWLRAFKYFNASSFHELHHVTSDELMQYGNDKEWSVVFVDHEISELRHKNVIRFAKNAQIVVVHDAEPVKESIYMLNAFKVTDFFKYKCNFTVYDKSKTPITTLLLSNFIDFSGISSILKLLKTDHGHTVCTNECFGQRISK
jgi:hypothetical protein